MKSRHPEKENKPVNPIKKNLNGLDLNLQIVRNSF